MLLIIKKKITIKKNVKRMKDNLKVFKFLDKDEKNSHVDTCGKILASQMRTPKNKYHRISER